MVIIPLTNDLNWQSYFSSCPELEMPAKHLLVIAPHPDDETLGAGALIATLTRHGVPVSVIAVTDGENAYDIPSAERVALAGEREREQTKALVTLGVESDMIHRLRLCDSGLAAVEKLLTQRISEIARPDMLMLAPWIGDFHPDHEACARAASAVVKEKSLELLSYFFWTWHRATPDLLDGLSLRRFVPDEQAMAAKSKALAMHDSQLRRSVGDPILPDRLLGPSRWQLEVFVTHA